MGEGESKAERFFAGAGEAAALVRAIDWQKTPLGAIETWPQALVHYVALVLELPSPAIIFWGEELLQIYNDGYAVIMGPRHPRYFGAPYHECWPDTYPTIHPWMRRVLDSGEIVRVDREQIAVTRYGFAEEAYFTFTFSPLRDDTGAIRGILQPVQEVTLAVLAERRAATLQALSANVGTADPLRDAAAVLASNPNDVPLYALFRYDVAAGEVRLAACSAELPREHPALRRFAEVARAVHAGSDAVDIAELEFLLADVTVQPWPEKPRAAVALPLRASSGAVFGVAVLAASARLHFDDEYRRFLRGVGESIASGCELVRLRAEAEAERARLRGVFMNAPAMIAMLRGPEHVFEFANPLYRRLYGDRDVVGKPVREAVPELAGQGVFELLDAVYASGKPYVGNEVSTRVARAPGAELEEVFVNYVYQPSYGADGTVEGIDAFGFEVTTQVLARRAAEDANVMLSAYSTRLEQSEERFRSIVTQVQAGIAQTDMSGNITLANERYCALVCRSRDELAGMRLDELVDPADAEVSREQLRALLEGGVSYIAERRYVLPDGSRMWVQESAARLEDESGAAHGVALVAVDITARKQLDAERNARVDELARVVRFSEMFAGILGHDLRNPLSAIVSAAGIIAQRAETAGISDPAARILRSAARMDRMIAQLLDFTRVRLGGGLPVQCECMDLLDVCRQVVSELEASNGRSIEVTSDGDTHGTWDPDRLGQLVSNLVANACQHGDVTAPVRVRLDGASSERVCVEVSNAGVIPPALVPFLFEPLRRGEDTSSVRRSPGLGLGLFIAEQIALAHGGSIAVHSESSTGTCFRVELPRVPGTTPARENVLAAVAS